MTWQEARHAPGVQLRAFAKINLTLDVFSKRPDGFHGIATVMQSISLHDEIVIEPADAPGIDIRLSGPEAEGLPEDGSNLAVRAAKAVLQSKSLNTGLRIRLNKQIPSQAGLGGGSSDAAAVIAGVVQMLNLDLSQEDQRQIAATLGSDVPFFLTAGTAAARGRGEQLTPLPDAPPMWFVIVKPPESVSTGWAYAELDAIADRRSHRGTKRMDEALAQGDPDMIISRICNDFELPVFAAYPALAWLQDEILMAGAKCACLCGSGSALFGVAAGEADATRMAGLLRSKYSRVYVARTLGSEQARAETIRPGGQQ